MYEEMISVIIPIYNVKDYIVQCINSVIVQTYKNLEIILVDDGSTDGCDEICERYAHSDNRIKVIHKQNGGLSDARNVGIELAQSDFITFIDSDDYVGPNYIYDMAEQINTQIGMVISMPIKFYDKVYHLESEKEAVNYNAESALSDMLYRKNIPIYAWAKLYRKSLFANIKFPKGQLYEDLAIMHKLIHQADQIVFLDRYNYYYRQRKGSIINSIFAASKMVQIEACENIVSFIAHEYPAIINSAYSKSFIVALNLYKSMPFSKKYRPEKKIVLEMVNKYKHIVVNDKKNKKITRLIAMIAIVCVPCIHIGGYLYTFLITHNLLKLKRPI